MAVTVHTPVLIPVNKLRQLDNNPKKQIGPRQFNGLRESLKEFGFSAVLNVALDGDGNYTIVDGNTRVEELLAAEVKEVSCIIHPDMAFDQADFMLRRRQFVLSFDRNRKVYDERRVVAELQELVNKGLDVKKLTTLSGVENLRRIVDESKMGTTTTAGQKVAEELDKATEKIPDMASLMLYGPVAEIDRIRSLVKHIKGRMTATKKVIVTLEQADSNLPIDDETFLACFLSAIARFENVTLGGIDDEVKPMTIDDPVGGATSD